MYVCALCIHTLGLKYTKMSFIFYGRFQSKSIIFLFSLTSSVVATMIQVFCTDKSHGKHVDINHYPKKAFNKLSVSLIITAHPNEHAKLYILIVAIILQTNQIVIEKKRKMEDRAFLMA